ncbi:hypothetical protein V866_001039 [Kwoniella sp. B9012]|uniref:Spermine/spermidine synthase n=1 Tax=Kwoniella europaea PYCC6329 TaxID=1423913 RepID=A0AAX4KBU1_9TREE
MSKVSFQDRDTLTSPDTPIHTAGVTTANTAHTESTIPTDSESERESEPETKTEPDSAFPTSAPVTAESAILGSKAKHRKNRNSLDSATDIRTSATRSSLEESDSERDSTDGGTTSELEGSSTSTETDDSHFSSEVDSPNLSEKKRKFERPSKIKSDKSHSRFTGVYQNSTSAPSLSKNEKSPIRDSKGKSVRENNGKSTRARTEAIEGRNRSTGKASGSKILEEEDGEENHSERESEEEDSSTADEGEQTKSPIQVRQRSQRTWKHEMVRLISLYLVPVLLAILTSLLLSLNIQLLTPLYNSMPLSLHTTPLYIGYTILSALIYWYITLSSSARDIISGRVCLGLAALSGDMVAVYGRRIGMWLGLLLGPEYGAVASRAVMGMGIVGGASGFALLCFDHISPTLLATKPTDRPRNLGSAVYRTGCYAFHIFTFERIWTSYLNSNVSILNKDPEKTILFLSLLLTTFSLFLRSSTSSTPFPTRVNIVLAKTLKTSKSTSSKVTKILPRQAFPLLLLFRIPLLILALRQQVFLRPSLNEPYLTANGTLRLISSERSLTGQVVVAENLKDGYRFLRCDHSILGGRWIREVDDRQAKGGKRIEQGDSIFATFNLQEIAVLAHRSDPSESLIRTLQLTTDLEVSLEGEEEEEKLPERALIIGLGVGIAASAFSRRGLYVDIVEIDSAVYLAAQNHFQLYTANVASTNIMDGSKFVSQLADMKKSQSSQTHEDEDSQAVVPMWDYVIQDCFTGGSVPGEMFTKEFWQDLGELVKSDGIVAMNFAGVLGSKASRAVLVTLTSVFPQCRAFGDGFEVNQGPDDLVNMVVFCTKTYSPLLTFRPPTPFDGLRSPLRAHVYSTFHPHEIQLDSIISEEDIENPELHLSRGQAGRELNKWQVGSSLATWRAMKTILTPEMWLAY